MLSLFLSTVRKVFPATCTKVAFYQEVQEEIALDTKQILEEEVRNSHSCFQFLFSNLTLNLAIQKVKADCFLQKMSYLRKIPWQASVEERAETTPNASVDQEESGSECWNLLSLMRLWDLTTSSNLGSIFWQVCQVVSLIARKQEL